MPSVQPQISSGTSLGDTASSIYKDANALAEKHDKQVGDVVKEMDALSPGKPPEMKQAPEPRDYTTSPMEAFGSGAMFLATFGSLMTRRPLENALNSGAAVMNAYHAGDDAAFKKAMDKFKLDTENSWKMANYELDTYKAVLGKDEAKLKALASSYKDNVMLHMADAKMAEQGVRDRERSLKNSQNASAIIFASISAQEEEARAQGKTEQEIDKLRLKWFRTAMAETKGGKAAQEEAIASIDWSKIKPADPIPGTGVNFQTVKVFANAIADGVKPSILGLGYGMNPTKMAVDGYLSYVHPDIKLAEKQTSYSGTQSEIKAAATAGGKLRQAVNTLDTVLPLARAAAEKVDLTKFRDVNAIENYARLHTGDPNITALNTYLQAVMSDYSSIIARNGVQTDSTRAAARELANVNLAKGQLGAFFNAAENEGSSVKKAIGITKKEITRGDVVDVFNDGENKTSPLLPPADKKYEKDKYYDLSSEGHGVHKYLGNGEFE